MSPAATPGAETSAPRYRILLRLPWRTVLAVLMIILLRAAILSDVPLRAMPLAAYDDGWFLSKGAAISDGQWLGAYDHLALIKGQGYPLFIAACRLAAIPLRHAQQGLYIASCLTFAAALAPWLKSRRWQVAVIAVLLLNPISFHTGEMGRIVREAIYAAQTLLVVACALGLSLRTGAAPWRQLPWAVALGFSMGWFWITREEAIWLVPTTVLLLLPWLWSLLRHAEKRIARLGVAVAGTGLMLLVINAVCLANLVCYGGYLTVEFRNRDFLDAYGSLARITHQAPSRYIGVPRDAREKAYAASPTFRRLQPYLEGPFCRRWIQASEKNLPGVHGDFASGWFMWALRDAAQKSESFASCTEAMRFYRAMADEINAACDAGQIPAGPPRSTIATPYSPQWLAKAADAFVKGLSRVAHFGGYNPDVWPSSGTPEALERTRDVTRSPLAAASDDPCFRSGIRRHIRYWIGLLYAESPTTLTVAGLLLTLAQLRRRITQSPVMVLALVAVSGAILARLLILAWIDATAFGGMSVLYLSPLYPLLLVLMLMALALACGAGGPGASASAKQ